MTQADPFLTRCREDRAEYARYLSDCEEGRFSLKTQAIGGGLMRDVTEEHKATIRRVVADLDRLIADMVVDDA